MDPKEIEPGRYYSVRQLSKMGVLPWRSAMTIAKALREEKWRDVFQPMMDPKKNAVRVHVKGENIIKFLEGVKNGDFSR